MNVIVTIKNLDLEALTGLRKKLLEFRNKYGQYEYKLECCTIIDES